MKHNIKTTDDLTELFVVVDKDDNIIGYRTRYDCHHDKSLIHRGIFVVVFNEKGEILLQKRSKSKDKYPGYLTASVGGHVGKGESYEDAAKREMLEEIGIETSITFNTKKFIEAEEESEIDVIFTASHSGPFRINPDEVELVQFVSKKELPALKNRLAPSAIIVFQELNLL